MINAIRRSRRKIFGLIVGLVVGGTASLAISKKASGFGFALTPEQLFKMFLEKAGVVMMRFFSNRFMSNLQNVIEDTSDEVKERNESSQADMARAMSVGFERQIELATAIAKRKTEREAVVPTNSCARHEIAKASQSVSNVAGKFRTALNERNKGYLLEASSSAGDQQVARKPLVTSLKNENGEYELKQLQKLVGVGAFDDSLRAERELAAMVSRIRTIRGLGTTGIEKSMYVDQSGLQGIVDVLMDSVNHLFGQRLKSTALSSGLIDTMSRELASRYEYRKLSFIELLEAEVLASSDNEKFYTEVSELPSLTTATVIMNNQIATRNKLQREILAVEELATKLEALESLWDERGRK